MGLQRFPYKDWRGGINLRDGPVNLQSDEAQDALNVRILLRGALDQRDGKTRFDTSGFPASVVAKSLRNWYFGSTRLLLASIDGDVYSSTTGGAFTQRFNGTAGTVWCFESALDSGGNQRMWAMNGVDNPKKWDGSAGTMSDWAGSPVNGTICKLWRNRMVTNDSSKPQRLRFSAIGNPESGLDSGSVNWVDIKSTEDDLDPITWYDVVGDYLVVFKRRSVWIVNDPTNFTNRRLANVGCEDRFQSAQILDRVYFFNRTGIFSTNGNNIQRESDQITPFFTGPDNAVGLLDTASLDAVRVHATPDRRLLVACPIGGSGNTRLWEYIPEMSTRREDGESAQSPWMVHDLSCASLCNFRPVADDVILAGDSQTNKVHSIFAGTNDDGAAIKSFYWGSWKSIFPEEPFERVRRVNVEHSGRLVLSLFKDLQPNPAYTKILDIPDDPNAEWDDGLPWDDGAPWDPTFPTQLQRGRPETRARYHSVRFSNEILDRSWTVYSSELVIRGGKEH